MNNIFLFSEFIKLKGKKYQLIILLISALSIFTYSSFIILLSSLNLAKINPNLEFIFDNKEVFTINQKHNFCDKNITYSNYQSNIQFIFTNSTIRTWAVDINLICDNHKILLLLGFVYFISSIGSYYTFANIPDKLGRRRIFIYLNIILLLTLIQLLYLTSIIQLIFFAFICGLSTFNIGIITSIISENLESADIYISFTFVNSMFAFCGLVTNLILYFALDWEYVLYILISIQVLNNYLSFAYMKESLSWLIYSGNFISLQESLKRIAEFNGIEKEIKSYLIERSINFDKLFSRKRKRTKSFEAKNKANHLYFEDNAIKPYSEDNNYNFKCFYKDQLNQVSDIDSSYDQLINKEINNSNYQEENEINYFNNNKKESFTFSVYDLFSFPSIKSLTIKHVIIWVFAGFMFNSIILNLSQLTRNYFYSSFITYTAQFLSLNIVSALYYPNNDIANISYYLFLLSGVFSLLFTLFTYWNYTFLTYLFLFLNVASISSSVNFLYLYSYNNYSMSVKVLSLSIFIISEKISSALVSILLIYLPDVSSISFLLSFLCSLLINSITDKEITNARVDLYSIESLK